jgi:hypothetical protein
MWWYIAFGIVFSIYALDLLFLFCASLFAAVVEYFVPPISTAATRAAKRRQRLTAAKQQQAAVKARGAAKGSGGKRGEDAAAVVASSKDLAIVVDTRNGASDPLKPQGPPGTAKYSHLTDLYRGEFPKVMIQLPMYNEDAHCELIIQRCCKVMWPSHRILIQVGFLRLGCGSTRGRAGAAPRTQPRCFAALHTQNQPTNRPRPNPTAPLTPQPKPKGL